MIVTYTGDMSQFSHYPFKPEVETVVITYPSAGKFADYAVLHAEGCAHVYRAGTCPNKVTTPPSPEDGWTDDYYEVAPCLRAKGSTRHVLNH